MQSSPWLALGAFCLLSISKVSLSAEQAARSVSPPFNVLLYNNFSINIVYQTINLAWEASVCIEVPPCYRAKDMVDGVFSGDRAVERDKMTFQSVRDVVPTSSGMVHGGHVLGSLKLTFKKEESQTWMSIRVEKSPGFSRL